MKTVAVLAAFLVGGAVGVVLRGDAERAITESSAPLACKRGDAAPRFSAEDHYLELGIMSLTGSLMDKAGSLQCDGKTLEPYNDEKREGGDDWPPYSETMVGRKRLQNIRTTLEDVVKNEVPGDFVETGAWRGGVGIFAKMVLDVRGQGHCRKVHLFDAWEALPYGSDARAGLLAVKEEEVRQNFVKYNVLDDNVALHKGLFKDTLPSFRKEHHGDTKIAVLRIDGNFLDSHQDSFYYLYDMLSVGGYVIIDDYYNGTPQSEAAVTWAEFQKDQGFAESLITIDHHGAYFKKTKEVAVDMTKMRPPRDCNKA